MIFRGVQMVRHSREHPRQAAPGEAAFRAANKQIISNKGTTAFGNNSESIALGNDYAKGLKILREGFFTKKNDEAFSITKGEFLTYCQLNKDSCVFLVHVPELRRFTAEAKASLSELAWINAQAVLKANLAQPPATVVVGLKGAVFYESICVGDFVSNPSTEGDGIKSRGSGVEGLKLLYPFFAD